MIPESIEVDVEGKPAGTQFRIADLPLGEGVSTEMDPEDLVVSVIVPQGDTALEEADAEAAEAAAAEGAAAEGAAAEGAAEDTE